MSDLSKEVDDMLGSFLAGEPDPAPVETPPVETPPVETPPVETPPVEEPPAETPPVEEPPVEEPPTETPPVEGDEDEPEEETAEQLKERLEKTIAFYEGRSQTPPSGEPKPAVEPKPGEEPQPQPAPQPKEIKVEPFSFVTKEAIEQVLDDPEALAKLINDGLNQARTMAIQEAIPMAQEQTMLSVPQVTAQYIKRYNAMKSLVDDFYGKNPDLKMVQRSVGMIANEIHSEHTDWTIQQVFDEAATRTRGALGLKAPVPGAKTKTDTKPVGDPAFANPSQSRQRGGQKKLTGMAKEIDDLIS